MEAGSILLIKEAEPLNRFKVRVQNGIRDIASLILHGREQKFRTLHADLRTGRGRGVEAMEMSRNRTRKIHDLLWQHERYGHCPVPDRGGSPLRSGIGVWLPGDRTRPARDHPPENHGNKNRQPVMPRIEDPDLAGKETLEISARGEDQVTESSKPDERAYDLARGRKARGPVQSVEGSIAMSQIRSSYRFDLRDHGGPS